MLNSRSPYAIVLAHTLPAVLLIGLFANLVSVIHPLLTPEILQLWKNYGIVLALLALGSALYAGVLIYLQKPIHITYGIVVFLCYVPLLFAFGDDLRTLIPWEVPRWMRPADVDFYPFRLLSIPLAHALFLLIKGSLHKSPSGSPGRDILIAIAIPISFYVLVQVIEVWRWHWDFERHFWIVGWVTFVFIFLFFLLRGLLVLVQNKNPSELVAHTLRGVIALVLPLLGLAIHNGYFGNEFGGGFGDLDHWGFYVVALLNGLLVISGSSPEPRIRFVQFVLRAIGFSYVLYFFLIFLPFLPLSLIAIIAVGFGFLMLAPILLFMVQGSQLLGDIRFLSAYRPPVVLGLSLFFSMLVLPIIITLNYTHQRKVLHSALEFVYHWNPQRTDQLNMNASALGHVLDHAKNNNRTWNNTPFLSSWYSYVVLDNLALSTEKSTQLKEIFLDEEPNNDRMRDPWRARNDNVQLTALTPKSVYDQQQHAWRTWVDLSMYNKGRALEEYTTTFHLPPGAYITDEYLMINGLKVHGILAEKKAANWVYQQIVSTNRDPSITQYIGPDHIELRVFPFAQLETRYAGFEVLHKEPFALTIDNTTIQLGDLKEPALTEAITTNGDHVVYVPGSVKQTLPLVERDAEIHILMDGTEKFQEQRSKLLERIERMINKQTLNRSNVILHIVDMHDISLPYGAEANAQYLDHSGQGGYFTDRAIRKILINSCSMVSAKHPVIVLAPFSFLSEKKVPGIWLENLDQLAACIPEGDTYYILEGETLLERTFTYPTHGHPASDSTVLDLDRPLPVHAWPNSKEPLAYLPNSTGPSIALTRPDPPEPLPLPLRNWNASLELEGHWRASLLHPEDATNGWRKLIRGSFETQLLTPLTAFICLENDAQRNALLKKQEELLNGNAALDAGTETLSRMSEPELWWLLPPMLVFLWWRRRA